MSRKLSKDLLEKAKKRLQQERVEALSNIEHLKEEDPFADPDHASDNAAVDTDVREQLGHDTIEAQIKDQKRRLDALEKSLERIEKGLYGVCDRCGEPIPEARLSLVPEAIYCVSCEGQLRK